ncbi:MAG: hypothetical protein M1816_008064 [Peltula sp. TS41687]|nr:MAG: hypothetical protein M1816_008064 [Peltula sp. TS41687]
MRLATHLDMVLPLTLTFTFLLSTYAIPLSLSPLSPPRTTTTVQHLFRRSNASSSSSSSSSSTNTPTTLATATAQLLPSPLCDLPCITDALLFNLTLSDFLSHKASQSPPDLQWDDNGCSHAPDHPSGFNFLDACKRHDFGYRNYRNQRRFSERNRRRIDENLRSDLYRECASEARDEEDDDEGETHRARVWACRRLADVYVGVVRALGVIYDQPESVTGERNFD